MSEHDGLDLLLLLDTTGSMGTYLAEIQRQLMAIVSELSRHVEDVRCGVVAFKDHGREGEAEHYLLKTLDLTRGLDSLGRFLSSPDLAPGVGGGGAEAVECALHAASEFRWRADARKAVILIGDKPPHGAGLDGFHCCPDRVDYRDELEKLAKRGVAIYSVLVGDCMETRRVFEYFSARTGGTFLDLKHARDLPNSIISVCHKEAGNLYAYRRRLAKQGRLTDSGRVLIHALAA